jgi:hypothetical protein
VKKDEYQRVMKIVEEETYDLLQILFVELINDFQLNEELIMKRNLD